MAQKITPNVWFDGNAKEASDFYLSAFGDGRILTTEYYPSSAEEGLADFQAGMAGKELIVDFELGGFRMTAINAGPEFVPNPSISLMVNFDPASDDLALEHLDELWAKLIDGGRALMPLDEYPFSKRYGWVEDKYGLSWQLILTDPEGDERPFIVPSLLFVSDECERAEEATDFYISVFKNSRRGTMARYPAGMEPNKEGAVMFTDFQLENQWLAAMDGSTRMHDFTFSEGVSLSVACADQKEIDYFWEKLSSVPEAEQCGWCKDRFGLSWQVVPENMAELMKRPQAYAKMMEMKKLVIADF